MITIITGMAKKFYLGHKIGVNPRSQSVRALHAQSKNLLFFFEG